MSYEIIKDVGFKDGEVYLSAEWNNVVPKTWTFEKASKKLQELYKKRGREFVMSWLITDVLASGGDVVFYPMSKPDIFLTFIQEKLEKEVKELLNRKYVPDEVENKVKEIRKERAQKELIEQFIREGLQELSEERREEIFKGLERTKERIAQLEKELAQMDRELVEAFENSESGEWMRVVSKYTAKLKEEFAEKLAERYPELEKEFEKLYNENKPCYIYNKKGDYLIADFRMRYDGLQEYSITPPEKNGTAFIFKNPLFAKTFLRYYPSRENVVIVERKNMGKDTGKDRKQEKRRPFPRRGMSL